MKSMKSFVSGLLLTGTLAVSGTAVNAEGILLKEELAPGSNYGHLRFPAIREDTLDWDRPVLKDPSSSDIIDYYGPLDHDPLGKDEITSQRLQEERRESIDD
jgi:hypothetical protein